jgi:putative FmdB family regulatory protein
MPAYDYHCERCGDFEVERRMSDPALENCPNCAAPVTRVFSRNVNFLFKGGGTYIEEYRSPEYKKQAAEEAKAAETAKAPAPASPSAPAPAASPTPAPAPKPSAPAPSGPATGGAA